MAERAEKRFQTIMDKLYRSPKSKLPPRSDIGTANAQQNHRRLEAASREVVGRSTRHAVTGTDTREGKTSHCRPWDRGDLMRRLATFKAMTWFGKPKAIDPVNCGRRGWVNVEVDTLACEACGSRLLFSVPSSWTLQQVEKAAAVFSLKLDNGHKLLCPWIDNICDEALAFYPPTPPPALIESYRERTTSLLRLSALPLISPSTIDYMKSPHLESFLANSSCPVYKLESGLRLTVRSGSMPLDSASASDDLSQYYQALKILSLCGWEPRVLPYIIDCKNPSNNSMKMDKVMGSFPEFQGNKNAGFIVYPSMDSGEDDGEKRDQLSFGDCDPSSVVLECKLCGACAGLWAFATILRPMELFNLSESPEEDGQNGPATGCNDSALNDKTFSSNLTIAGGPPPTRQSFKPRITLPILTRHARSAFGSNGDMSYASADDQEWNISSLELQEGNEIRNISCPSETPGMLKRKRNESEFSTPGGSSYCIQSLSDDSFNAYVDNIGERSEKVSVEADKCLEDANNELVQSAIVTENAENRFTGPETGNVDNVQPGKIPFISADRTLTIHDISDNASVAGTSGICRQDSNESSEIDPSKHSINQNSQNISSDVINEGCITSDGEKNKCGNDKDVLDGEGGHPVLAMQSTNRSTASHGSKSLNSVDAEAVTLTSRSSRNSLQWDDSDKFDPIRKHRPFCPWISQLHDDSMPGWKLTLRAVVQDGSSHGALSPISISMEFDDPIVSVRKLFSSPPSKRSKAS